MQTFEMSLEEMREYRGSSPLPGDFDRYWSEALGELEETGLEYQCTVAAFTAPGAKCSHLYFTGLGGARIHCKLLLPDPMPAGGIPGLVFFHGYSMNAGSWFDKLPYVLCNKAAVLVMDVRGQGGFSQDTYSGAVETLYGHVTRGLESGDPKDLFYRAVYMDTVKAARILMAMDGVDGTRIGVAGQSQGGALTVACAALEPRVKMAAPVYPYLSDFKRIQDLQLFSRAYEQMGKFFRVRDPLHEREDEIYYRLGYIDIQNLAPRIRGKVLWFCGLMDRTCPPSTQFAAYNKITAPKEMAIYPEFDHENLPRCDDKTFRFFSGL